MHKYAEQDIAECIRIFHNAKISGYLRPGCTSGAKTQFFEHFPHHIDTQQFTPFSHIKPLPSHRERARMTMPESPFRMPEEYIQHVGRVFSATQKSLFRIPTRHIRTFHTMVTAAEKPLPHAPAPASAPSRFLFHDFPLSKFFTSELHKYACRYLTERQRKDKHPYTISPRHPSIPHTFMTPPQRRQPVETQNLASHEKVSTIHTCNNQTVIIIFLAREAQPIASHTHDNQSPASAFLACETQDFASLLFAGSGVNEIIYTAGKTGLLQEKP